MGDRQRIGFIGLGLMGEAFTRRLVECGYEVCGYDIDADKVHRASSHGVEAAASPAEVAERADVVQVCVVSTAAVRDVILGEAGVIRAGAPGKVLVDHSTTVLEDTRDLAARLREATGMGWVDAPVSGGPPAARSGRLAIMAGGSEEDVGTVGAVMADLAADFTHMGPVGAGQITKMVNQILVLNNYCVLAEALALAEAGGIDAARIPQALGSGHAGSNLLQAMFPRLVARDFAPAGYARQVLKDLGMVQDLARALGVPTPITATAASLFGILVSKGHAELDGISVLKLYDAKESV